MGVKLQRIEIDRESWIEIHLAGVLDACDRAVELALSSLLPCDAAMIRLYGPSRLSVPKEIPKKFAVSLFRHAGRVEPEWTGVYAIGFRAGKAPVVSYRLKDSGCAIITGDEKAKSVLLTGVSILADTLSSSYQRTFSQVFVDLNELGFAPSCLARTWCYFKDVLIAYREFNEIRRAEFERLGITAQRLPASTGIQAIPASGHPLVMDALAFCGSHVEVESVANPAQCDASKYGSLFSRGVRITGAGPDELIASGMASIGDLGESLYIGDRKAQLLSTQDRALALLESNGLELDDIVSGIAYLDPKDPYRAREELMASELGRVPLALATGEVCRPELLFEVEFMAYKRPQR